ncbi:MAG: glycine cleavage system protein GcvH [Planctomycetaceae bacterium]|nr:glycine cleavage system protein GcvH [Planctomycetaceae bacterium]
MAPGHLKYAKTHEWLALAGDIGTIGISDFAVKELTDLVYIGLPSVGKKLSAGDVFGEIESVKAVSDLYAPVSGEVIEVNEKKKPEDPDVIDLITKDAFGAGWLIKMRLSNPAEASSLLDAAAYEQQCAAGH